MCQRIAEYFSPRCLRRVELEVFELQELINQLLIHRSARPHRTTLVILLLAIGVMPHYSIDRNDPRSSIEVIAFIDATFVIKWDKARISYPSNILASPQLRQVARN